MTGGEVVLLAIAAGCGGVGYRLLRSVEIEMNGTGKLETAKRHLAAAEHEAKAVRTHLQELDRLKPKPGEGAP